MKSHAYSCPQRSALGLAVVFIMFEYTDSQSFPEETVWRYDAARCYKHTTAEVLAVQCLGSVLSVRTLCWTGMDSVVPHVLYRACSPGDLLVPELDMRCRAASP